LKERIHGESLKDHAGIDQYLKTWTSDAVNPTGTTTTTNQTNAAAVTNQMNAAAANTAQTNAAATSNANTATNNTAPQVETVKEEQEANPDNEMDEEVFDPNDIIQDILREEQEGGSYAHVRARDQYLREKDRLIGEKVQAKTVEWTVREDVVRKAEVPPDKDYEKVGVRGFDFNKTYVRCGKRNADRRIIFLDLLIKLWPGDWRGTRVEW
jgi:hypothetical protein